MSWNHSKRIHFHGGRKTSQTSAVIHLHNSQPPTHPSSIFWVHCSSHAQQLTLQIRICELLQDNTNETRIHSVSWSSKLQIDQHSGGSFRSQKQSRLPFSLAFIRLVKLDIYTSTGITKTDLHQRSSSLFPLGCTCVYLFNLEVRHKE